MFWGNLGALRCFAKRIVGGGIGIGVFWEGCAWDHVGGRRRGDHLVFLSVNCVLGCGFSLVEWWAVRRIR
jgi:hypothetical protein